MPHEERSCSNNLFRVTLFHRVVSLYSTAALVMTRNQGIGASIVAGVELCRHGRVVRHMISCCPYPERRNTRALDKQIKLLYGSTYRMLAQAMLLRAFLGVLAATTQGERVR